MVGKFDLSSLSESTKRVMERMLKTPPKPHRAEGSEADKKRSEREAPKRRRKPRQEKPLGRLK